ncbi:hypothetical protein PQQ72_15815 [Paraburkholderia strydomiana]|uniref:hypothetical protein n=1 Tax=Paraburkholderia strydomiana TaxID=1245417 RepID=UPI0038BCA5D5
MVFVVGAVVMTGVATCFAAAVDIRPVPFPVAKSRAQHGLVAAVKDLNRKIMADASECGGYYWSRAAVSLDTTSIFSVEVSVSGYCGGPYPLADVRPVVFDAITGERYSPLTLYQVGWQQGISGSVKWRTDIRDVVKRRLILSAKATHDGGDCSSVIENDMAGDSNSAIDAARLGLGRDGLYVYPEPAHVVQVCYKTVVLPYSSVHQYLNRAEASRIGWMEP